MPHSSGGGSHGGGSHGGSHHSGSGRSSATRISQTPYPGARRYRYFRHGKPHYFYTTREPGKIFDPKRLLIGFIYLPFIFGGVSMLQPSVRSSVQDYDTTVIIKDEAGILEDEKPLYDAMEGFQNKSGIPPAVVTVNNETWMNHYNSLEDYAYDRYLAEFDDEMHWLIVYSEPTIPDTSYVDWYWEGMQGDYTDFVLTDSVTSSFNYDLQTRLNDESTDVAQDLTAAFQLAAEKVQKPSALQKLQALFPAIFLFAFIGFHAFFMMGLYELKYRKAEPAPEGYDEYGDDDTKSVW